MTTAENLDIVVTQSGIEPDGALVLKNAFSPFLAQAEEWRVKVATVTDPLVARASRLTLKSIRVEAEKTRKKLKEDSVRRGKAIDGLYNVIEFVIAPLEKTLSDIETAAERAEAARRAALVADRTAKLSALGFDSFGMALADYSDERFAQLVETATLAHKAKLEAAAKAEAERVAAEKAAAEARAAKEKADAEERERVRIENERLKKEAAEREEAARQERLRLQAIAEVERQKAESARKEAEKAAKIAAEKAAKEKAASEAKLRAEREARAKLEAEAEAARKKEEKRKAGELAEIARAAAAPDREKLHALAELLRTIERPEASTRAGKEAIHAAMLLIRETAARIETKAQTL